MPGDCCWTADRRARKMKKMAMPPSTNTTIPRRLKTPQVIPCARKRPVTDAGRLLLDRGAAGQKNEKNGDAAEHKHNYTEEAENGPGHPLRERRVGLAVAGRAGPGRDRAQARESKASRSGFANG